MSPELPPPRVGLGLLKRALAAAAVIVLTTAGAVSAAVVLEVDRVKDAFLGEGRQPVEIPEITLAEAGGPRTVLFLGSDLRYEERKKRLDPRSDTIILARVDPNGDVINLMSIPRDLKIEDLRTRRQGRITEKINRAYAEYGPRGTVREVKRLFEEASGRAFPISNVVSVDFSGFWRTINYIGGVYVDVDRDYFNDNATAGPGEGYATIDVDPGYQRLQGHKALDYVRYRHGDSDLVRAARQQDFLRQVKGQAGLRKLTELDDRIKLARLFGRYFELDSTLRSTQQIVGLLRLGIFALDKPIQEIPFRFTNTGDLSYIEARRSDLRRTAREFLDTERPRARPSAARPAGAGAAPRRPRRPFRVGAVRGLQGERAEGELRAIGAARRLGFPFYFPTQRVNGAIYEGDRARVYTVKDELNRPHRAYRLVLRRTDTNTGEYYGVQGLAWRRPPILDAPTSTRVVNGRKLLIYNDGSDVRIVAWRTRRAVYWVSNTLTRSLTRDQMIAIAASLKRLGER